MSQSEVESHESARASSATDVGHTVDVGGDGRVATRALRIPRSIVLGAVLAAAQLVFLEAFVGVTYHESAKAASIARDLLTFIPFLAPIVLVEALLGTRPRIRAALLGAYFFIHALVDTALIVSKARLDFAFVRDNIAEATHGPGLSMVIGAIPTSVRAFLIATVVTFTVVLVRGAPRFVLPSTRARAAVAAASVAAFALCFAGKIATRDSICLFGNSIVRYYATNTRMAAARQKTPDAFPLVHRATLSALPAGVAPARLFEKRPNVILVLLESFSAGYVGKNAADGAPYTPVMNEHIARAMSAPHFYGNSIQTCHGHFAALCSLVPSYRLKEAYIEPLDLNCLPDTLHAEGYTTALYTAAGDSDFDRIGAFGKRMGFDEARTADAADLPEDAQQHVWGWGLQDDVFYDWAFDSFDALAKKSGKPFFLTLAPVSNHYPFDEEPNRTPIEGEATPARGKYAASLRASDARLAHLFAVLEKRHLRESTVVILTGDHSFPADEHGSHWNERGFYEESFRVPFVMEWPGHVAPQSLEGRAFSQIDIAPTILDLLRIERPVAFQGRSMFSSDPRAPFVPLVQPYDGQYLGSVVWPWKYVEHGLSGDRRVVNLESDPEESHLLPPSAAPAEIVTRLQDDVERIHLNQALLSTNQVWNAKR